MTLIKTFKGKGNDETEQLQDIENKVNEWARQQGEDVNICSVEFHTMEYAQGIYALFAVIMYEELCNNTETAVM